MKIYEGNLVANGIRVGVVCARFNEFIVSKLLSGCEDGLLRRGVRGDDIHVAWVPGAFEIPLAAAKMAKSGRYDAVIALGALESGVPVLFGVLTTDTIEQAIERAGSKAGNKGAECAQGAIEMVDLLRSMAL